MALHRWACCVAAATAVCELLRLADGALPRTLPSESAAIALLKEKVAEAHCDDPDGAGWLMGRGWWNAARELVTSSHSRADEKCRVSLEKAVRREVSEMKIQADGLVLALTPPDTKVGVVRCSFQWAQNSTHIFLAVKFSHRWSSPGALKVHDEKAAVTNCCFNFSAAGEHSQLRKRYTLDLAFYKEVDPARWSWHHAANGRFTVEIRKKDHSKWPRLFAGKDKPSNMGMWDSMHSRWQEELEEFERRVAKETRMAKAAKKGKTDQKAKEDLDAEDEQLHEAKEGACYDSPASPFWRDKGTVQLCEDYWPPTMKGKRGMETPWLVLFYSPVALKCRERETKCTDMHDKWSAMATRVIDVAKVKIGIVDCDLHTAFCTKHKVGHMPFVRRYKEGKKKAFYEEWDIDSIMKFVL